MSKSVEVGAGQSAQLPMGYLGASLTGASDTLQLSAVSRDGADCGEPRESDRDVIVRPGRGEVRLVVRPRGAGVFPPGARVGVEVKSVATAGNEGPQILVEQVDIGGYKDFELARVIDAADSGWRLTVDARAARDLDFMDSSDAPSVVPVDERELPWVTSGRYALRSLRGGDSNVLTSARPWAVVVDSSASFRAVASADTLVDVVEQFAGVLVEWSGRLPVAAGVTGLSRPKWSDAACDAPRVLVDDVLQATGPASWTLVLPAVEEASSLGAHVVGVLVDGPPSDLAELAAFLDRPGAPAVVFGVVTADSSTKTPESGAPLLSHFAHMAGAVQAAVVTVDNWQDDESSRWAELVEALKGVER